jgi:hypothetical protein
VSDIDKNEGDDNQKISVREKGWKRGFTVEENRIAEFVELYESIGYKVRVEPATPDEQEECQTCFKADFDNLRTIFIKRIKNKENGMDLEELK